MSNSPFEIFRRNLKPMMVGLTGLALFAFVVLPVLDTYMRRNAGAVGSGVVARFGDTDLTQNRVDYFTRNHQSTIRFLAELAERTIARGGTPKVAGFEYDTQNNQVRSVGINQQPSIEGTIRTFMLASEAQKNGFDLDDTALQVWLEQYTDGMISNNEIDAMLMESTQLQMGRPHLYEQLRNHLLASVFLTRGYAGLFMGDNPMAGPVMTPEESWANFLKLNRNAVVSTYGVLVNDYLDKTNPSPSDAEIQATYEEGKDRDPSDQSAEPAFHRPYSATFEYLVGTYQQFLDEEVAKLSEEAIRAEYERRLEGGEFQLPDTGPDDDAMDSQDPGSGDESAAKKDDDDAATSPPDKKETEAEDTETPASQDAGKDASAASESTDQAGESDASSDAGVGDSGSSEGTEPPTESGETDQPQESDQSQTTPHVGVRLVGLQETESSDEQGKPSESTSDEPPAAGDDPGDDQKTETEDAKTETEGAESEPEGAGGDAAQGEDGAKTDDDAKSKDDAKTDDGGAPADDAPRVESFADVRDRIASEMASPAASQRMQSAIADVVAEMRLYFNKKAIHDSNVSIGQEGEPPERPDLEQLAEKYGLQHETIGPYTQDTITDEPIASSAEMGSQFGSRGPSFSVMMFGFDNGQTQLPPQQLFAPIQTSDGPAGKQYVAWKIAETDAYSPTLSEVRDEVVMAIRMKEARAMAREAAEAIAEQASKSPNERLQKFVPVDRQDNVKEGLGPFSWMNSFGFAGASIGNVEQLDAVGEEFMRAVFTSDVNECAVAANQPGRVVYVIKPTRFEPSLDQLRSQFKQETNRMMAMILGNDSGPVLSAFFEEVDQQAGFVNYLDDQQATR